MLAIMLSHVSRRTLASPGTAHAAVRADTPRKREMLTTRLGPLPVAISLAFAAPAAAQPEPAETWTCARWLDGREHHRSKTMETWVHGYLTSSNQWALALGWTATPLLLADVLTLLDKNCKSTPNAPLAEVLDVIQSEFLRANWRDGK
jgi:hypothetical protein